MSTQTDLTFEPRERQPLTVSELTARVKHVIEANFSDVRVVGEISQFTVASSGHVYLTLKDEDAVLKGIIWRSQARQINFELEEGLEVVARGNMDVYAPRGSYQLIIREVEPRGIGALQLAFRQLMERLEQEGLFGAEHKKELPRFPGSIGVITSPTGAAIRDIVRVISRRWPLANLYLLPRRVQGDGAAEEIAAGIRLLNLRRPDLDLMIVGRGGGSLEDLWAFNEEVVARAIFDSDIPVVSAVGHEVDVSIADFVADVRVATPSAAGENVVPDRTEMLNQLDQLSSRLARFLTMTARHARDRLNALRTRHVLQHPERLIEERSQRVDELWEGMRSRFSHMLELQRERTEALAGRLEALSPLKVMGRGYSIAFDAEGEVLRSIRQLDEGDSMKTRLGDGWVEAEVERTEPARQQTHAEE